MPDPIIAEVMLYSKTLTSSKHETNLNFDLIVSGHNYGCIWHNWMKPLFKLTGSNIELFYPIYTKYMLEVGKNGEKMIVSEGITKFNSSFGCLQALESFHKGTIENVRVSKKEQNNF